MKLAVRNGDVNVDWSWVRQKYGCIFNAVETLQAPTSRVWSNDLLFLFILFKKNSTYVKGLYAAFCFSRSFAIGVITQSLLVLGKSGIAGKQK
jgi:hypothetical protein